MPAFSGSLRPNEVYAAIYNMILSQQTFADNIQKHQTLVEKAKEDAGLFGDQKLFYSTDVLKSVEWTGHENETNLLQTHYAPSPKCQALVIDNFRGIYLTTDEYLSKRAWGNEGAFSQFISIMIGWMSETKKIYEGTMYNVFIGTDESSIGEQQQTIDLTTALSGLSGIEKDRKEALVIAQALADLMVAMGDYSRDFNDYQYLRSYADENIHVVWNSKYLNKIRKQDLPTIWHKEGLVDKMEQDVLPARYFGRAITESDIGSSKVIGSDGAYDSTKGTLRAAKEFDYNDVHYFPGDALATSGTYVAVVGGLSASQVYLEDSKIICKVMTKLPPLLTAFEASTSFFNARALLTNRYTIFGFSTLEHLKNYPMITVREI